MPNACETAIVCCIRVHGSWNPVETMGIAVTMLPLHLDALFVSPTFPLDLLSRILVGWKGSMDGCRVSPGCKVVSDTELLHLVCRFMEC